MKLFVHKKEPNIIICFLNRSAVRIKNTKIILLEIILIFCSNFIILMIIYLLIIDFENLIQ